jgi:tRNA(Ile)-lysidine synthase
MPAPAGLVQQFDQHLHRRRLLAPNQRLLVACSGGADSVALLRLLCAVNQSHHWNWELIVGHVNHQLRGRESDRDEEFVRKLAQLLQLPLRCKKLNLLRRDSKRIVSENVARDGRYKALLAMAATSRCDAVLLAHHADDQAETILMRLLRGAGVTGLAGINEKERRGTVYLVRPLLPWPGAALRYWLKEINQPWREDLSNQDTHYLRNRIRYELLPALETYQPRIRELLQRNARHDRATADFLKRHADELLRTARFRRGTGAVSLAADNIAKADPAPAAVALRTAIIAAGGDEDGINSTVLQEVLDKLQTGSLRGEIQFGGSIRLKLIRDRIHIRRASEKNGKKRSRTTC